MNLKEAKLNSLKSFSKTAMSLGIACCLMTSCEHEEVKPKPLSETQTEIGKKLSRDIPQLDKDMIFQLAKLAETIQAENIWNGYEFHEKRMYFVHVDRNDNPVRGYIVNPHKNFAGAEKLPESLSHGLDIYEFDEVKGEMMQAINNSNGYYDLNYEFRGELYHPIKYSEYDVKSRQTGTIAVHEVFHAFQGYYGQRWRWIQGATQDSDNYPISNELVSLQVLSLAIMEEMPAVTELDKIREHLKMYVAIRSKEMELDFSSSKLVKNMANPQERGEGTANFVEEYAYYHAFDKNYRFIDFEIHNIEDKYWQGERYVHGYFTWSIWYDTGASAVYCLKKLGANMESEMQKAKSPFDVAEALLNMSSQEKEQYLNKAKQEYNWNRCQRTANKYIGFMNTYK